MPNWEMIDLDKERGIRKYLSSDEADGSVLVRVEIDDASIVEGNKIAQNEDFDRRADLWHAASIPTSVMYEWLTRYGVNAWNPEHQPAVKRLLNSSDYRWCKVKNIIL